MSIHNAITLGGTGEWTSVANSAATSTTLTFPTSHAPTEWVVFRITDVTQATVTCYIRKDGDTYYEWYVGYDGSFGKGGTPTGTYNNGTFTVTRGRFNFTAAVGNYVLVYI